MATAPATGTGSFVRRRLEVAYTLGKDTFDGIRDTINLSGQRMSATIAKPGGGVQGTLQLRIYGLTPENMNKMMVLGAAPLAINKGNTVMLKAGSGDGNAPTTAYYGTITNAWPDFEGAPDVALNVTAFGAIDVAMQAIPPSSYKGAADVANIMADLANKMGKRFENNGVSVMLSNSYFPGSAYSQAEAAAEAAGIHMAIDDGTLTIWPRGGSRGGEIPLVSATTGMIGYPMLNQLGIEVRTLYNPAVTFGAKIKVESILQPACGEWQVSALYHNLECETPDGAWFSRLSCLRPGYL